MRKAIRLSIRVLLGLTTMVVVGFLLLAWRLERNPLELDRFVAMAERAQLVVREGDRLRLTDEGRVAAARALAQ